MNTLKKQLFFFFFCNIKPTSSWVNLIFRFHIVYNSCCLHSKVSYRQNPLTVQLLCCVQGPAFECTVVQDFVQSRFVSVAQRLQPVSISVSVNLQVDTDKIQKFISIAVCSCAIFRQAYSILTSVSRDAEMYKVHKVMLLESMCNTICFMKNGGAKNTICIYCFSFLFFKN